MTRRDEYRRVAAIREHGYTGLEPFGHVLDMLGEVNAHGYAVTIAGMGSGRVMVMAGDGTGGRWAEAATLTLALESLRRKVRRAAARP